MPAYLIGAGGWAYFQVPNKHPLKAYSEIFNFVEVNSTFYEYPQPQKVSEWRSIVPADFTFSVRCHQDLTHRIGLKPVDAAYDVFNRMTSYCSLLSAPFLVLETPVSRSFSASEIVEAQDFFSSVNLGRVQLAWEYRAPFTSQIDNLMRDFGIVRSMDVSVQKPPADQEVVYSRVFGKGQHNLYQFVDEEIVEIEQNIKQPPIKKAAVSFHGARMYNDAARTQVHMKTGAFMQVTNFFGVESARAVLKEDAKFPASKTQLIEAQGWKVIDLSKNKRVHLSTVLSAIPEKTYKNLNEVAAALEASL